MPRLPIPGSDSGNWGSILNDYLSQSLKSDGTIKDNAVTTDAIAPGAVVATSIATNAVTAAAIADNAITAAQIADGSIAEAQLDTPLQTKINTAAAGVVPDGSVTTAKIVDSAVSEAKLDSALQTKVNTPAPVTSVSAKTGVVTLDKTDVGLANVDNTSDADKPVSTATQTALNAKVSKAGDTMTGNLLFDGVVGRKIAVNTPVSGSGQSLTIEAGGAQTGSTDTVGGYLILASGSATGNNGSSMDFRVVPTGQGTGTTTRVPVTRMRLHPQDAGRITLGSDMNQSINGIMLTGDTTHYLRKGRTVAADSAGTQLIVMGGGASTGATNKGGGDLTLASGLSTGNSIAGAVRIQTCTPGTSGTTDNTFASRLDITYNQASFSVGVRVPRTAVADANYSVLLSDYIIALTSLTAPRTITLPTASGSTLGTLFIVKDETGQAAVSNIIVNVAGGAQIDGASTSVISTAYGSKQFYCSGSAWFSC